MTETQRKWPDFVSQRDIIAQHEAAVSMLMEEIKRLEAEVERLKKYKMFFESCSCFFAEGTEFMTKAEIYEAIKKETKNLK